VSYFDQTGRANIFRLKTMKPDFGSQGFGLRSAGNVNRQYTDREVVYSQGEAADAMFRVKSGHVKLTIAGSGSRKAVTAILSAGDCFGEGCLVGETLRRSTATSVRHSTISRVSKRTMAKRLRVEPAFARLFIAHLLVRMGRVEADLLSQLVNSSERKLARLLIQLSGFTALSGRALSAVDVDQGTLAQAVGTTRSRVSHFMNDFRKKGFVDYNGILHVHKGLLMFLLKETARA
jgi:CRP/FNR family cyclic AMP-dependent transcriptional regulator